MEKGPSLTYYGPTLLPWIHPLVDLAQKSIQMCGGGGVMSTFIPNKFGKYPSSDSVVKADSGFQYIYIHLVQTPPHFIS